ncbi:putative periplasmic lipoprotein [Cytobacillus horneckiae]|uniref:Uncharacterized protein n=1 Tax=Cytobacillus horneckiae TaxID=549687 RepID=A0A2N0ZI18_9BACI|nr:hypothetical protein [Cytobacillus horneckiae]MEC1157995.1 hypothetical protein [Cytobacillus horneckiae]MED2937080.1 hypothetical protein [Cytobacillus horneckiae]PKG29169.1 hypothetical protein CWS20_10440 [Cytobacillus horneckiae]
MKKIVIAVPLAFMLVGCSSTFELIDEKDVKETEAIPSTTSFKMSASEEVAGIIFSINEFILTSDTTEVNLEIENTTSATPAAWNAEEMSISINGKQLNAIDFQGVGGKIEAGNYQEGKVVLT